MPQTTSTVPMSCALIEMATASACTPWTDISGSVNAVTGVTQTKAVGDEYTFDGPYAISEVGKFEPFDMTVRIMYTNVAAEAYRAVREVFHTDGDCDGKMCLRIVPGGTVGDDGFVTNYAPVISFQWFEVNAGEAGPIALEFVIHVASIDPIVYVS